MSRSDCRNCDHPNPKNCGCGFGCPRDARQPQMHAEAGLQLAHPSDPDDDDEPEDEDPEDDDGDDRMEFPGHPD